MSKTRAKRKRRKATAAERRRLGLGKGAMIETVDLHDQNLAPEHRDRFTNAINAEVARYDELIAAWYRHRGECHIAGCDCGGQHLAEQVEKLCPHLFAVKHLFGVIIIDDHPHFRRFVKEFGGDAYARLTATACAQ